MSASQKRNVPSLKRVVLGVTGGVAAYKSAELARLLVKRGELRAHKKTLAACGLFPTGETVATVMVWCARR